MSVQIKDINSPMSQAVAVYRNMMYMAVRRPDNNEVNILRFNGRQWEEFGSVPGVRTLSPPALTSFQDRLYMAVRGEDNRVYLSAYDGAKWHNPEPAPGVGTTLSGPAISQFGNLLHVTYSAETDFQVRWAAFNPKFRYGTYKVREGDGDLRDVSAAIFRGNRNRYKEIALLNYLDPMPGTDMYPVQPGDVLLTPPY